MPAGWARPQPICAHPRPRPHPCHLTNPSLGPKAPLRLDPETPPSRDPGVHMPATGVPPPRPARGMAVPEFWERPAAQPVPRTSAPCSPWPSDTPSLFEPPSSGTSFQPPGPHHTAVPEHRTIHPLLEVLPWHPYSEDKATAGASGHQAHIGPLPTPKDMPTFLLPRAPAHAAPFASSDAHPHPISS